MVVKAEPDAVGVGFFLCKKNGTAKDFNLPYRLSGLFFKAPGISKKEQVCKPGSVFDNHLSVAVHCCTAQAIALRNAEQA